VIVSTEAAEQREMQEDSVKTAAAKTGEVNTQCGYRIVPPCGTAEMQ